MPNEIRIQAPSQTLTRGQTMRVPITVVVDRPLKFRGIHAKFHGAAETKADYTTTSTNSKGRVTTHHHTAVQLVDIVAMEQLLAGSERLGFVGGVSDAFATMFGGGKHELLQPGEHPFEVEVAIPDDAPPTHTGKKSRVFYELTVDVDIPAGLDLKAKCAFRVDPIAKAIPEGAPVRIRYPEDAARGFFEKTFGPDVRIDLALATNVYLPADTVEGMFRIESPKPLTCRAIRANLVGSEGSEANGHHDMFQHLTDRYTIATPGTITDAFQQEFSFPVPEVEPASCQGALYSIEWFFQITLDVPWATDPSLKVPITLLRIS